MAATDVVPGAAAVAAEPAPAAAPGRGRTALKVLRDPFALAGLVIYLVLVVVALLADRIATHDPTEILFTADGNLAASLPPGGAFWLGTTSLGRDIFSQLVLGSRPSLLVGVTAAAAVALLGTLIGILAGYLGGATDRLLMRLADVLLGLPFLPSVIVVVAILGPDLRNIVLAVAVLLWPNAARVIRAQVLTLSQRQFVEAARVTGAGDLRIMLVHVAPNVIPLSFLYGSIAVGWAILTQASVSFLGFAPSDLVSWGTMLQDAYASQALDRGQYAWFLPPGICIVLVVLAGFLVSRGYEEFLYPKLGEG